MCETLQIPNKIMKLNYFLALAILSCSSFSYSQVIPCVDGMAGDYPCDGYDLVSHLSISDMMGQSSGNDIWGWTDPESGTEYALMGLDNGTAFVSLADPEDPELIGFLPSHTESSIWRDIKVYQNHAYIVSEAGSHGMQVYDMTQLAGITDTPATLSETAHYGQFGHCHNIAINEATGFAYPIGAEPFEGGPIFIDITDPDNPTAAGGYDGDGYTHDAQVVIYEGPDTEHTGKEIILASNEDTFTVIDATDKSDPEELSRTGYPNFSYTHQGWFTEDQRYFLINDETDEMEGVGNTRTMIFDCLDLDAPVLIGQHFGTTAAIDHNMYVKGDLMYQANYAAGLQVISLVNVADAVLCQVGHFDVRPEDNDVSFDGAWSVYPYFESGNIIVSSIERGLFVVKASDPLMEAPSCVSALTETADLDFMVYPIPADDLLEIRTNESTTGELVLSDAAGRQVMRQSLRSALDARMDISALAPGIYHLELRGEQGLGYRQVMVR